MSSPDAALSGNSLSLIVYSDGAARGNPGPAGIGVVITDAQGKPLSKLYRYVGQATNNEAEYRAVIAGLEAARRIGADTIRLHVDSELVARQLQGQYRVKSANLFPLFRKAYELLRQFKSSTISHVRRDGNREADALANRAIDEALRRG